MLIIATTRLSKAPLKQLDVSTFKLDKIFLLVSAVISAILLLDGYNFIDGIIFVGMFIGYILTALYEMKKENRANKLNVVADTSSAPVAPANPSDAAAGTPSSPSSYVSSKHHPVVGRSEMAKAALAFLIGTLGIVFGASPFISSLQSFSVDIGVSTIVLAVIISPIAGEMPEKISMMILARKGAAGASIAIANVLGSKVLNNSLLLGVAIFAAMYHGGFYTIIVNSPMLWFQMVLATSITLIALVPLFRKTIGIRVGIFLLALYIISIVIQFFTPGEITVH
jgi:cation:H+ antiporter